MNYEVIDNGKCILETDDSCEAHELRNRLNVTRSFNTVPVFVRRNLVAVKHTISQISVYRFYFKSGFAFYYLDEETGVFQIYSDWGNYSYCWQYRAGSSLADFILNSDCDYLTSKLVRELPKSERLKFNSKKTIDRIKDLICKHRRKYKLTETQARELFSEISDVCFETDKDFYDFLENTEFVEEHYGKSKTTTTYTYGYGILDDDNLWEYFVYDMDDSVLFLRESLLPFLKSFLKERKVYKTIC